MTTMYIPMKDCIITLDEKEKISIRKRINNIDKVLLLENKVALLDQKMMQNIPSLFELPDKIKEQEECLKERKISQALQEKEQENFSKIISYTLFIMEALTSTAIFLIPSFLFKMIAVILGMTTMYKTLKLPKNCQKDKNKTFQIVEMELSLFQNREEYNRLVTENKEYSLKQNRLITEIQKYTQKEDSTALELGKIYILSKESRESQKIKDDLDYLKKYLMTYYSNDGDGEMEMPEQWSNSFPTLQKQLKK